MHRSYFVRSLGGKPGAGWSVGPVDDKEKADRFARTRAAENPGTAYAVYGTLAVYRTATPVVESVELSDFDPTSGDAPTSCLT